MEQSPWADSKDIPALYGVRNSVAIFARPCGWPMSWDSWIQSTTSVPPALRYDYFRYSQRSSLLRVSHHKCVRIYLLSHAYHMPRLSCRPWSYDFNNVWLKVKITKLFVTQFFITSLYFLLLRNKYFSCKLSFCVLFPYMWPSFKPIQNKNTVIVLSILVFTFLDNSKRENCFSIKK